jgi:chemotaxis protein methyltransferase CheR
MRDSAYGYVVDLVRRRSSVSLDAHQVPWVESRLAPLARELGHASVDALVERIAGSSDDDLHDRVVQSIAVNETSFFRDPAMFAELADDVLPAVRGAAGPQRPVVVWSAGCATGQEPYSVAMVAREVDDPTAAGVTVLATDFSARMVERTRLATYTAAEVNRGLPARHLARSMVREGTGWRVADEVRELVTVARHHLVDEPPPARAVDVVLLRNVLIYFDLDVRRRVLDAVRRVLSPDGFLVLGGSETTLGVHNGFVRGRGGRATWFRPVDGRGSR